MKVTKEKLQNLARYAAGIYINSPETSPSEIVARVAKEHALPKEAIQRLIEFTNREIFLQLFHNSPDKTVEFPIATFREVMAYLRGDSPEAEGEAEPEDEIDDEDYTIDEDMFKEEPRFEIDPRANLIIARDAAQLAQRAKKLFNAKAARVMVTIIKQAAQQATQTSTRLAANQKQLIEVLKKIKEMGVTKEDLLAMLKGVPKEAKLYVAKLYDSIVVQPVVKKASMQDYMMFVRELERLNAFNVNKLKKLAAKLDPQTAIKVASVYSPDKSLIKRAQVLLFPSVVKHGVAQLVKEAAAYAKRYANLIKEALEIKEALAKVAELASEFDKESQAVVNTAYKAKQAAFRMLDTVLKGGEL